ncbi:flavin monoamine oxidase family protein [Rubrobacter aplysinae]|uniref:flavin monoamine oxidase family protein n=1 Tax=Rubrobacter aplysinae TaxID=909625 RepID=UPI00064BFD02|nr:FAD-dependent oxidoreductase [Rubrobacter aplysinae]
MLREPREETTEVAVVGAGLSGLTAARKLERWGIETLVLEARDRVGGRTQAAEVGGVTVDLGGEWVDEAHSDMRRLCAELDVDLFPFEGSKTDARWHVGGESHDGMPLSGGDERVYRRFTEALVETSESVDLDHPWISAPSPDEDVSVEEWLRREGMSAEGLHVVETAVSSCGSTVPLSRMSFHAYAAKTASRGGPGKGNEYRVRGGAGSVSRRLASELGERVRISSPVTEILQDESGVEVRWESPSGPGAVRARRVVLALPFTLYSGIRFHPEPPPDIRDAISRSVYGVVRKMVFAFEGEVPVSALTVTDTSLGYLCRTQAADGRDAVVSFAGGRPLLPELGLSAGERERRALETLAEVHHELPEPVEVREKLWPAEPWTRGSYMIPAPGDLYRFGASLGGSFGRAQLAGAEGVAVAPSFMNSAVRSGLAAGRRVAGAIRGRERV